MEQAKVFAGNRIFVTLPQKTDAVRIHELVERSGIVARFLVVSLDRPRILRAAVDHLHFAIAAQLRNNGRQPRRHRNERQGDD
jgi:hypothetical protein